MNTALAAKIAAAAGAAALLAGCANSTQLANQFHEADEFGHAVRQDLAAQIVNPEPAYHTPPPASSGQRAALAQTRYATDSVKQPAGSSTTAGVGGGGGGGGGGAQ